MDQSGERDVGDGSGKPQLRSSRELSDRKSECRSQQAKYRSFWSIPSGVTLSRDIVATTPEIPSQTFKDWDTKVKVESMGDLAKEGLS